MSNDQGGGFEFSFEEQPQGQPYPQQQYQQQQQQYQQQQQQYQQQQQPYPQQTYADAGQAQQPYQAPQSGRTIADHGGAGGVSQGARTVADGGGGGNISETGHDLDAIVGRTIDRYSITRLLGEGGFGAVYLAQHTLMKRDVAFKTLHADLAQDPAVLYRFLREGQCSTRFKHRNAIELYDFGQMDDGTYFMAMELLHGEDLRDTIKRKGALELGETFDIMIQTLGALHSMHEGGVIHRDLKPDNIKLEEDEGRSNFVKVFDFGIAKLMDSDEVEPDIDADPSVLEQEIKPGDEYKTTVGAFFGTPEYGSPEQCAGEEIDPRSDLYTMGVILYECLTGQLPFASKTPQGYLAQHMVGEPKPAREINTEVPEEVELLVQKSMAKDREERYQTAAEFAEALVDVAQKCGIPLTVGLGDAIVVKTPVWKIALFTLIPIIAIAIGAIYYVSTAVQPEDTDWVNAQAEVASLIEQFKYEDALAKTEDLYGQRFGTEYPGFFNGYFDEGGTEAIEDPTRAAEALVSGKLAEVRGRIEKRDTFIEAELKKAREGLRKPLEDRVYLPLIAVVKPKVLGDPEKAAKPGVVDEIDALEREVMRTRKKDSEDLAKKLIKESDPFLHPDVLDFDSARNALNAWPTKFSATDANALIVGQREKIDGVFKGTSPL
ncbi:MAG: serine/threonine protein kinase, partial [Planctomycetota bacterium]